MQKMCCGECRHELECENGFILSVGIELGLQCQFSRQKTCQTSTEIPMSIIYLQKKCSGWFSLNLKRKGDPKVIFFWMSHWEIQICIVFSTCQRRRDIVRQGVWCHRKLWHVTSCMNSVWFNRGLWPVDCSRAEDSNEKITLLVAFFLLVCDKDKTPLSCSWWSAHSEITQLRECHKIAASTCIVLICVASCMVLHVLVNQK
jgi:hypothetical protein